MNVFGAERSAWTIVLVGLFVLICAGSTVKVVNKASKGGTAFVRWMADTEKLSRGETIYSTEVEGYPNLPMAAVLLMPFHKLGPIAGSILWLLLKSAAIAGILCAVAVTVRGKGPPLPGWMPVILLALSSRVFVGDLTHGNINLIIGGLISACMMLSADKRDFSAGFVIGLATILKVTPLLFVVYFLWKRRWTSLLGVAVGIIVFGWFVPGLVLGFKFNHELIVLWYKQMVHPFVAGTHVGYMQTRYDNQSFTGLFYRLLCDTVAILPDARHGTGELRINLAALDQHTVSIMLKTMYASVLALLAVFARTPRQDRRNLGNLGEFAMIFLAALFISERSWKHHYVMIILAHAFILRYLQIAKPTGWRKLIPAGMLTIALLCHHGASSTILGHHGSNIAEAYGVYLIGAMSLFAGCAAILVALGKDGWPTQPSAKLQA